MSNDEFNSLIHQYINNTLIHSFSQVSQGDIATQLLMAATGE